MKRDSFQPTRRDFKKILIQAEQTVVQPAQHTIAQYFANGKHIDNIVTDLNTERNRQISLTNRERDILTIHMTETENIYRTLDEKEKEPVKGLLGMMEKLVLPILYHIKVYDQRLAELEHLSPSLF